MRLLLGLFCLFTSYLSAWEVSAQELILDLVEGNYNRPSQYKALQLFTVDEDFLAGLQEEVLHIIDNYWTDQNKGVLRNWSNVQGTMAQFSLFNASGNLEDFHYDYSWTSEGKKFHYGDDYPHLAKMISYLPGVVNFRVNKFSGKSGLRPHQEDICLNHSITKKPAMKVRFHLPLFTNEGARLLIAGDIVHFEKGKVYFFHNGCIHDSINEHPTASRIHILWDMLLTEDTFEQMFVRSKEVPFFTPIEDVKVVPIRREKYSARPLRRDVPYELARKIQFCPMQ